MESMIYQDRLKGYHLVSLSKHLGMLTRHQTAYVMGIPPATWYGYANSKSDKDGGMANSLKPIKSASICILTRFGFSFPDRIQRTHYPDAKTLYKKLQEKSPDSSYNDLARLLGREISAGHRWLSRGNSFDGTTRRLALHLNDFLNENRLGEWRKLVNKEVQLRNAVGAKSLTLPNGDEPLPTSEISAKSINERLLVVGDIDVIRNSCSLDTQDSLYHLGLSQKKWNDLGKMNPLIPIRDPSLSILLRLYFNHPEDLDAVKLPSILIDDVFEELNNPDNKVSRSLHPDEVALLLGFTPSCVQRWRLNTSVHNKVVNYSPKQQRLISHFYQEIKAGRFDDWYQVVMVEAKTRGIKNLWETGWSQ